MRSQCIPGRVTRAVSVEAGDDTIEQPRPSIRWELQYFFRKGLDRAGHRVLQVGKLLKITDLSHPMLGLLARQSGRRGRLSGL